MIKKHILILIGVSNLLFFFIFTYFVHNNIFNSFDIRVTIFLQNIFPHAFDEPFSLLSLLGQFEPTLVMLIIVLLVRRKLTGIFILLLFGVAHIIELYGKTFIKHLPPPHSILRTKLPFQFPSFYLQTDNSYPSGHATRALFMTIIVFIIMHKSPSISKKYKIFIFSLLCCYDMVMLVSRVYLGEHWFSDIAGGVFVGLGLSLIGSAFI